MRRLKAFITRVRDRIVQWARVGRIAFWMMMVADLLGLVLFVMDQYVHAIMCLVLATQIAARHMWATFRKGNSLIRQRDKTFIITWRRTGEKRVQHNKGLTPVKLTARLLYILRNERRIEILRLEEDERPEEDEDR